MHDAVGMRKLQRAADPFEQHANLGRGQRPRLQPLLQRHAIDELHRDIGSLQLRFDSENIIAGNGVVLQVVQDRRLALEHRHHVGMARHIRADQFDRDGIAGGDGDAFVDFAHAAFGDQALDLVDAVQPDAGAQASLRRLLKDGLVAPVVNHLP